MRQLHDLGENGLFVHMPVVTFCLSFFTVDFALKVVKWSDNVTIKLQLWDIAGE